MSEKDNCCMCGASDIHWKYHVRWCRKCEHFFCKNCRSNWFERGMAAVKEHILKQPPMYCQKEGHDGTIGRTTGPP